MSRTRIYETGIPGVFVVLCGTAEAQIIAGTLGELLAETRKVRAAWRLQ